MHIEWEYSEPRRWDVGARLLGPGYTRAELGLTLVCALGCALVALAMALRADPALDWWQLGLAMLVAFDLGGGVPANATGCAKRWWWRPGQGFWHHFGFNAAHVHPFVFALLYPDVTWRYAAFVWGALVLGTLFVLLAPRYLQRPLALSVVAAALLAQGALFAPPAVLAWLAPVLWLKLIAAHAVFDAPYRPTR